MSRTRRSTAALLVAFSCLFCLILGATPTAAQSGPVGGIRGSVYDKDFEVPLSRARVTIAETNQTAVSNESGTFLLEGVAAGRYTLTIIKDGYDRLVVRDVVVAPGRLTEIRVDLISEVFELEELVVTGEDLLAGSELGLLEIRATAISVQDAISSELISKAGVGDAAGALKLVVGASVVDGKYATVRGLSDRYTGTTLNGIRVPSADPRRRAVQIDLFPTGTIDNITVTKTFTPDLQGDFTGGGVDIQTKSIPDEKTLSFGVSVEYDEIATGNDEFVTYRGGGVPAIGFDYAGDRQVPEGRPPGGPQTSGPRTSQAEFDAAVRWDRFTRAFDPVMGTTTESAPINHGFSFVAGNRYERGDGKVFGVLGALTYSHDYSLYRNGINDQYFAELGTGVFVNTARIDNKGTDEVLIGGLLSLYYQPNERHELSFKTALNQAAEDEARLQFEQALKNRSGSFIPMLVNQSLTYTERTVSSSQFHGSHRFPGFFGGSSFDELELDWDFAYSYTRQNQPDARFFRYQYQLRPDGTVSADPGDFTGAVTENQRSRRIFQIIEEFDVQTKADAKIPFLTWNDSEGFFKTGFYIQETERRYSREVYYYLQGFSMSVAGPRFPPTTVPAQLSRLLRGEIVGTDPQKDLWTDIFLEPDKIGLVQPELRCPIGQSPFSFPRCGAAAAQLLRTITPDVNRFIDYKGQQRISAAYGMVDLPITPEFRVTAGARYETTSISVTPTNPENGTLTGVLPSGTPGVFFINESTPQELLRAKIQDVSLLPSVGLTYSLTPEMKLRASWSRTIARPTFREIAPAATAEFLAGDEFLGNPNLELVKVKNYDLRWEWFRKVGQVFAFSLFRKELSSPIEFLSARDSGGSRSFVFPTNYESGELEGWEAEIRLPLDAIGDELANFTFGANYTKLDSKVRIPQDQVDSLADYGLGGQSERPLLGQPEYVLNLNLTYDNEESGTTVGIFYNEIGDTLLSGAAISDAGGVPTTAEKAIGDINFKVTQELGRGASISVKANNIGRAQKETVFRTPADGDFLRLSHERAMTIGASLNWEW